MSESSVGVRPSTTIGIVNVAVDVHDEKVVPVYKHAFGDVDNLTRVDADNPLPVAQQLTFETDALPILNEISLKLSKLLEYQALLHEIDLGE